MRDRKSDKHRTIGQRTVGRKLGPDEVVHHKDEDKDNNTPTNLEVKPRAAHTADHLRTRTISRLRTSLRMHAKGQKLY